MPFSANPVGALTVDISFQWLLCLLACKLPKLSSEIFIVGCPVWCMIGMNTGSFDTEIDPFDDIVNLGGFPTDVDVELPFVGDNINSIQTYGSDMLLATIKDAVLTVKNIQFGWGGMPKEHFIYAICVRDKSIVTE